MRAGVSAVSKETNEAISTLPAAAQAELKALASPYIRTSLPQPVKEVQEDASKTCVQRVQEALAQIEKSEGDLNACIEICKESALKLAKEADEKVAGGAARRPLEGVPLLVKGNVDVKGTLTTAGMEGFAGWKPEATAPVAQALIDAGAITIAKTTLPEAAFGMWGWSKLHGLTRNPFNTKYSAGGSSTGSAVGLAAGYGTLAIGSDTEGSMRGPAEYAGVVGLRPTLGRYSDKGIIPCNIARDTAGLMACTVADVAVMDAIVTGAAIGDYMAADLSAIKVAMPKDWAGLAASDGTKKALELASAAFEGAGATVNKEVGDFKPLLKSPVAAVESLVDKLSFRSEGLGDYIASHQGEGVANKFPLTLPEVTAKSFYPNVKKFFDAPVMPGAVPMINILEKKGTDEYTELKTKYEAEVQSMADQFTRYFDDNGVDVILSPCTSGPPNAAMTMAEHGDPASFMPLIMGSLAKYAPIFGLNAVPIPSITMPTTAKHENPELGGGPMPAGILLWARPKDDKKLLEVAMALEVALAAAK